MPKVRLMVLMAFLIFFGLLVSRAGYSTLREWRSIGPGFAAFRALWALAGPLMFLAGWWAMLTLGQRPTPLWLAGGASMVAGGAQVVGMLTHVVPCSGPN